MLNLYTNNPGGGVKIHVLEKNPDFLSNYMKKTRKIYFLISMDIIL